MDGYHDMEIDGFVHHLGWNIMFFNGEDLVDCVYERLHTSWNLGSHPHIMVMHMPRKINEIPIRLQVKGIRAPMEINDHEKTVDAIFLWLYSLKQLSYVLINIFSSSSVFMYFLLMAPLGRNPHPSYIGLSFSSRVVVTTTNFYNDFPSKEDK